MCIQSKLQEDVEMYKGMSKQNSALSSVRKSSKRVIQSQSFRRWFWGFAHWDWATSWASSSDFLSDSSFDAVGIIGDTFNLYFY